MPDPYVKQTWIDGVAGATPISAARLAYIEDGIENATMEDDAFVDTTTDQRAEGVKTFAEVRISGGRPWHDARDVIRNVAPGADTAAAINAVIAGGGVGLAIPPNTALDVGEMLTPGDNTEIKFFGPTSSLARMTNTAYPLIRATSRTGVRVSGGGKMTGTATSLAAGGMGAQFQGCTDSGIEGIEIYGQPGDAIGFDSAPLVANHCWAIRNKVHDNKGHGIQFTLGHDMLIAWNEVWSQTAGNAYVLGYSSAGTSRRARLIGNRADTAGISAFQLSGLEAGQFLCNRSKGVPHGLISDNCSDVLIALNAFRELTTTSAIGAAMFLSGMTDCTIALNRILGVTVGSGNGYGIRVLSSSTDNSVVQNRISAPAGAGVYVEGPDNEVVGNRILDGLNRGIALWGSQRAICRDNIIRDCVGTAIQMANNPAGSRVYGNDISNPAGVGASPTAIDVQANTASSRIYGNHIYDWTGTRILKSGTGTSTTFVRDDQITVDTPTYTATNAVTDRAYDANATTADELADVVATLIADLRANGTLK